MIRLMRWQFNERAFGIAVVAPADDFGRNIRTMQRQVLTLALVCLALFIPAALAFASRISEGIAQLARDATRIRRLDFSGGEPPASRIIEFHNLGEAFGMMKNTLATRTHDLDETQERLARLVNLGIAMSAEENSTALMEMILLGAKELTYADGGTLYTMGEDGSLHFQILRNDTLKLSMGGVSGDPIGLDPVPLAGPDGTPNHRNMASHAVLLQQTIVIDDAYGSEDYDFSGTQTFDRQHGYRTRSLMTVPLKPRGGDVIGALQLVNARDPSTGEVIAFPEQLQRFVEALAAQAATALYNRDLLASQDRLMDAMIQLIAGAIDAKSPYTGGHCERVPELAVMLAEEACKVDHGPLADFRFKDEKEWREFRIGAWLHDCGKVITPEFVVDKATKLETIYNRIHEIRTRFEVLLRDAEIERLTALADGDDPAVAEQRYEERRRALTDDFAFVAECNLGSEFMAPEKLDRLKDIAATPWIRHFDDHLGLAHDELRRAGPAAPLPAAETLLADKPRHLMDHPANAPDPYAGLGFQVPRPRHLYNAGELYNLSISRGTLTEEERFKINEHIMQTIAMLERMPFPKPLRRVPEYAGTHHETLTGSGYPRKLDRDQLSIPARIMAIADIFEALTASDRPYKKAKTLSESIRILKSVKDAGHIDPDLFDLFITSGVIHRYAERFLLPEQRDMADPAMLAGQ